MKKYVILISIFIVSIILSILLNKYLDNNTINDELRFKEEYESLNDKVWEIDGYKGSYINISIPKNNLIKYATNDNIVSLLKEGTHVIYFGNASCNWCRSAVSVLINNALDYNLNEIYYYDFFALRNAFEEGSDSNLVKLYEDIIIELDSFIEKTFDENSKVAGKKRLSAPTVVVVSNGEVVDAHYKTVDTHIDYNKDLSEKQKDELSIIYQNMFKKMVFACTDNC